VINAFNRAGLPIFFTRDWHPPNHCSFEAQGGVWPPHCVRGTSGAEFHQELIVPREAIIVSKATEPDKEAYSGFDGTSLASSLKSIGVTEIFLGGLATDYCVKGTALDALREGVVVNLMLDCIKGVDLKKDDSERAIRLLVDQGVRLSNSKEAVDSIVTTRR
jgi:nicotinamidase/pyrazinamidase